MSEALEKIKNLDKRLDNFVVNNYVHSHFHIKQNIPKVPHDQFINMKTQIEKNSKSQIFEIKSLKKLFKEQKKIIDQNSENMRKMTEDIT